MSGKRRDGYRERERRENEERGMREIAFCLLFQSKITLIADCNHTHTHTLETHAHTFLCIACVLPRVVSFQSTGLLAEALERSVYDCPRCWALQT